MNVLIKNMEMPKGCIYANDNDQTEYCPLLNHDDVPFCQYIENEPEIAIGIDERPVYCPLSDVPEPCQDTVSRQAAIDATWFEPSYTDPLNVLTEVRDRLKVLPSAQPERKKPVFKTGESVYHVSYADGTGGFEKNKWADWTCPDCGWFVGEQYIPRRHNQQKCNYCAKCGCAIDWSDADMRGEQDGFN